MREPHLLHRRAVAMIAKALEGAYTVTHDAHRQAENEHGLTRVSVRLQPRLEEFSTDLADGVASMGIPEGNPAEGDGLAPDIMLYDGDGQPVRAVVVMVAGPSDADRRRIDSLRERAVDVVQVRVRSEVDLLNLFRRQSVPRYFSLTAKPIHQGSNGSGGTVRPTAWEIREDQAVGDEVIRDMAAKIRECSPAVRRELADVLRGIDSLDSLYPVDD